MPELKNLHWFPVVFEAQFMVFEMPWGFIIQDIVSHYINCPDSKFREEILLKMPSISNSPVCSLLEVELNLHHFAFKKGVRPSPLGKPFQLDWMNSYVNSLCEQIECYLLYVTCLDKQYVVIIACISNHHHHQDLWKLVHGIENLIFALRVNSVVEYL